MDNLGRLESFSAEGASWTYSSAGSGESMNSCSSEEGSGEAVGIYDSICWSGKLLSFYRVLLLNHLLTAPRVRSVFGIYCAEARQRTRQNWCCSA